MNHKSREDPEPTDYNGHQGAQSEQRPMRPDAICARATRNPADERCERPHKPPGAISTDLGTIERQAFAPVLRECSWNRTRTAKRLGLTRTQFHLRLQLYGLEKPPEA